MTPNGVSWEGYMVSAAAEPPAWQLRSTDLASCGPGACFSTRPGPRRHAAISP